MLSSQFGTGFGNATSQQNGPGAKQRFLFAQPEFVKIKQRLSNPFISNIVNLRLTLCKTLYKKCSFVIKGGINVRKCKIELKINFKNFLFQNLFELVS